MRFSKHQRSFKKFVGKSSISFFLFFWRRVRGCLGLSVQFRNRQNAIKHSGICCSVMQQLAIFVVTVGRTYSTRAAYHKETRFTKISLHTESDFWAWESTLHMASAPGWNLDLASLGILHPSMCPNLPRRCMYRIVQSYYRNKHFSGRHYMQNSLWSQRVTFFIINGQSVASLKTENMARAIYSTEYTNCLLVL